MEPVLNGYRTRRPYLIGKHSFGRYSVETAVRYLRDTCFEFMRCWARQELVREMEMAARYELFPVPGHEMAVLRSAVWLFV